MKRLVGTVAALGLMLTGCASADSNPASEDGPAAATDFLDEHGLGDMDAAEAIDYLDRLSLAKRPTDLMGSVYPDTLVLSDSTHEVALDLPTDSSYLSIAPYVEETHDCFYHSLTTCVGELGNERVDVQVTDDSTGDVIVDEKLETFDNGFVGVWVPSGIEGTIEISQGEMAGGTEFSTAEDGATCITDLQLT